VTEPDAIRREPPRSLPDERALLEAWLDYYRATLLDKCAGLSDEQLVERSCPPSPMSLIGIVRHMTEMERGYAHRLADLDTPLLYCTDDSPEGDFEDISPVDVRADLDTFTEHCARSREIMAGHSLDDTFGRTEPYTLRWVYLYLHKEYARHLGHVDLLRERIDGATGE
jgi:Protein of unknown function (DUF664)